MGGWENIQSHPWRKCSNPGYFCITNSQQIWGRWFCHSITFLIPSLIAHPGKLRLREPLGLHSWEQQSQDSARPLGLQIACFLHQVGCFQINQQLWSTQGGRGLQSVISGASDELLGRCFSTGRMKKWRRKIRVRLAADCPVAHKSLVPGSSPWRPRVIILDTVHFVSPPFERVRCQTQADLDLNLISSASYSLCDPGQVT